MLMTLATLYLALGALMTMGERAAMGDKPR